MIILSFILHTIAYTLFVRLEPFIYYVSDGSSNSNGLTCSSPKFVDPIVVIKCK